MTTKNNEIFIFMICGCGFGDQYTSILTAFHLYEDLTDKGYNVKVAWSNHNPYFSIDSPLSNIYDLSQFNTEIKEYRWDEIDSIFKDYIKLPNFTTVEVYVKHIDEFLKNYKLISYYRGHWNWYNDNDFKEFEKPFLTEDILKKTDELLKHDNKNICGIHFRVNDLNLNSSLDEIFKSDYYKESFKKIDNYISNNSDNRFMICSNNEHILKELSHYDNTFFNTFSFQIDKYNVIKTHGNKYDDEILILHAKEILAEMAAFSKCSEIISINTFPSNFISYGVIHNELKKPWFKYKI
jgi:hypothetical protein